MWIITSSDFGTAWDHPTHYGNWASVANIVQSVFHRLEGCHQKMGVAIANAVGNCRFEMWIRLFVIGYLALERDRRGWIDKKETCKNKTYLLIYRFFVVGKHNIEVVPFHASSEKDVDVIGLIPLW